MSFYRSDDMEFFRLIMPRESAWDTINLLGMSLLIEERTSWCTLFRTMIIKWWGPSYSKWRDANKLWPKSKTSRRPPRIEALAFKESLSASNQYYYIVKIIKASMICGKFMKKLVAMRNPDSLKSKSKSIGYGITNRSWPQGKQI